jgi:transglutaminase-like putative cysteine protease
MTPRVWGAVGWFAKLLLRIVAVAAMTLTPLFGFWLASSLAAYHNGSQWVALLVGLALFPILPIGWDLFFVWRRSKRPPRKPILTRLDRLVVRTLVVSGVFLGGMMWFAPQTAFRAIAVRGDWMLDGYDGDVANAIRGLILGFADHFERRWHKVDTRYGESDEGPRPDEIKPPPKPTPDKPTSDTTKPHGEPDPAPTSNEPDEPEVAPGYPMNATPDPVVTGMPAETQVSIEEVGKYLAANIADKKQRVKAVHDFVVLRLTYDDDALAKIEAHDYAHTPSQEAKAVFDAKKGVCAGYAKLMTALGKAAGLEISYVTGYIRDTRRRTTDNGTDAAIKAALEGYGHAWNAAKIDGTWYLIDATWDDPTGHAPTLESTYLFTPPELFVHDHLPEKNSWQLLERPLSPGEFVRQPFITPFASRLGITVVDPVRSLVTVEGSIEIVIDNPRKAELLAVVHREGEPEEQLEKGRCTTTQLAGTQVKLACELGWGQFEIQLYGAPKVKSNAGSHGTSLSYFGSILANSK